MTAARPAWIAAEPATIAGWQCQGAWAARLLQDLNRHGKPAPERIPVLIQALAHDLAQAPDTDFATVCAWVQGAVAHAAQVARAVRHDTLMAQPEAGRA